MAGIAAVKHTAKRYRLLLIGGLVTAWLLTAANGQIAAAQDIQALVCRLPAAVSISRPSGDTVSAESAIILSGPVRQANQLEVYIDDMLDTVVPLSAASTTYTATAHLQEGTHTIKIMAIDACQIGNAEASVVLTYQPTVSRPSVGAATQTNVDDGSGVRIGPSPGAQKTAPSVLPPFISRPLQVFSDTLDLNSDQVSPVSQGALSPPVRFGVVLVSGLLLIFSQSISASGVTGNALQFFASRLGIHHVSGSRLLTILVAIGGIVVAFLL